MSKPIFVFGSNLAGRHGKGAAKEAVEKHGAIYGKGVGHHGNSYAIPTKKEDLQIRGTLAISLSVTTFLEYAEDHPELEFNVTRIGCGLAGYLDHEIAPMFKNAPKNCHLPFGWRELNGEHNDQSEWSLDTTHAPPRSTNLDAARDPSKG